MSSTCSAVPPADGVLACIEPDTALSRPVKLRPIGAASTRPTSQASRSMTTCEPSQPTGLQRTASDQLKLWPEALPAKTRAKRTTAVKVLTGIEPDCSSSSCGWCAKCDPVGFSLRMSLAYELEDMTGSTTHWCRLVTPLGRSWWELRILAPRISASASGSLPTPLASMGGPEPEGRTGRKLVTVLASPRANKWGESDSHGRRVLTPTAKDNLNAPSMAKWRGFWNIHGQEVLLAVYEWLMGFPAGWLASAARHTGMRSSRKSRKRLVVR